MNALLPILLSLVALGGFPAADTAVCVWDRFQFEVRLPFSGPQKLGLDAVVFVHPAGAAPGRGRIEIALASFPKDMVEGMGMSDKELLEYFKTTFLGAGPGGQVVERAFLGRTIKGDKQETAIPRAKRQEAYLVPLPEGGRLGWAVSALAEVPEADMEKTAALAARTLKLVAAR